MSVPLLPVTGGFAPAFAVYYALLNLRVSLVRVSCKTMMGTDVEAAANHESQSPLPPSPTSNSSDDQTKAQTQKQQQEQNKAGDRLLVSARCHANFVENVPLALLVASVVEINGGNTWVLTGTLAALLLFRIAHVEFGLRAKDSMGWGRPVGYFGTLGFVVGMSSYAAWLGRGYWNK
ncbi:hypothetical protein AYL99_06484 [Fonsecaea erecta]|uniref:Glutathione S-transferase n=1 Tax=Fonsecaea erecta TaxID=1367422 RepID=A0A178ZIB0_9EURO|nr:hypothetical protein AYL99_06484 [Fonsecaea erecta]OAP59186.1 hypothetical protein AYL99_06484 [Fonsecaea erecta]